LHQYHKGQFEGLFTLGAGVVNLALALYFFKRENPDRNLLYLLIGLTLTFVSLAIPIQLQGHTITLLWSAEFVLLSWLYQRSRIRLFHYGSLLISALSLISLLMDWAVAATNPGSSLVLIYTGAEGLVTNIVSVAAFAALGLLLQKQSDPLPEPVSTGALRRFAWSVAVIVLYLPAVYGVNLYFKTLTSYAVPNVYHRLVTEGFVLVLCWWLLRQEGWERRWRQLGAITIYLLYHLLSYVYIEQLRDGILTGNYSWLHLWTHEASNLVLLYLVYRAISGVRDTPSFFLSLSRLAWIISILMVVFFSMEAQHLYVLSTSQGDIANSQMLYGKAVLTIVWALCSFALMWLGMRFKNKTLRIISLSLFSLTLLKLFLFDLAGISEGGKIVSFILLGVLLLTISFMYQKLKKMIIDDAGN
jgi:hypothetical protein